LRDTRAERAVVGLIHSFSDFENRCELGKIETPNVTCSELRIWSDFAEAKIAKAINIAIEDLIK